MRLSNVSEEKAADRGEREQVSSGSRQRGHAASFKEIRTLAMFERAVSFNRHEPAAAMTGEGADVALMTATQRPRSRYG